MFLLKFGLENRGFERKFHVNGVYGLRPKRICDHNRLKSKNHFESGAFLGSGHLSSCSSEVGFFKGPMAVSFGFGILP